MTRNEIYQAIKANGLVEKANAKARELKGYGANYTNLSNTELLGVLDTVKTKKECKKESCAKKSVQKCVDEGARKAILAVAKILNIKGIEKNFE